MNITSLPDRLNQWWSRITEPLPNLRDSDQRIQARFLASLFLIIAAGLCIVLTGRYVLFDDLSERPLRIFIAFAGGLVALLGYRLVRQGRIWSACILMIIQATVVILKLALIGDSDLSLQTTLYYIIALILFASHFLSIRDTALIAVFQGAAILVFAFVVPFVTVGQIVRGPFSFYVVLTIMAVLFAHYRRRIEQERQQRVIESEFRYRTMSQVIPNFAFSFQLRPDGLPDKEWVTDGFKRVTGYDWDTLTLEVLASVFHQGDLSQLHQDFQQLLRNEAFSGEYRIQTASREQRWLYISAQPFWDRGENRVTRMYGVAQDITEQKQSEAQKTMVVVQQEQLKLLGDFVQALSHDFRTSLATIETSRYLAERKLSPANMDGVQGRFEIIGQSVRHMTQQLENLNAISALAGLERKDCDLKALIETLISENARRAQQRSQRLTFESNGVLPAIQADEGQLQRALQHLLDNALNYTPSGGEIMVNARTADQHIQLEVRDSGIGIAPQHLPHIFDFFYRADAARSLDSGGVGLGLSIARMIIEAHGGRIEAESTVGKGSTFTVHLPLSQTTVANRL